MSFIDSENKDSRFDSQCPETRLGISLAQHPQAIELNFSENPNLLLQIEDSPPAFYSPSGVQAGFLINQNQSCWVTNLGEAESTEVYRPEKRVHRRLAHNQVAYMRQGDYIGFYGKFYQLDFRDHKFVLVPIHFTPDEGVPAGETLQ